MNSQTLRHALETVFTWTWQTSLSATVLIALVLLLQFALRKILAPRWAYALGLLMLLRLALPFAPASSLSIFNLGSRFAARPTVNPEIPSTPAMPSPTSTLVSVPDVSPASAMHAITLLPAAIPNIHPKTGINFNMLAACLWLAGFVGMLVLVARRHRQFVLALRRWEPVTEPRVLGLLGECRARAGVKRNITLLAADGPGTPALFGVWRPRLLIPADLLRQLDDRELRHIFLHELIHLRHGDVLLNWVMIFFRSLHWFNPAVWLAMKKLRADQELACDAAVMARLAADERRQYGGTLLRLLGDFPAARLSPGLVPFVTNKHTIKRRIIMIATFKPAGRLAVAASLALLIALGCFTFTRAAEPAKPAAQPPEKMIMVNIDRDGAFHVGGADKQVSLEQLKDLFQSEIQKNPRSRLMLRSDQNASYKLVLNVLDAAQKANMQIISLLTGEGAVPEKTKPVGKPEDNPAAKTTSSTLEGAVGLRERVAKLEAEVRQKQDFVNALRRELGIPPDMAEGKAATPTDPETMRQMKNMLIDAEIKSAGLEKILGELTKLNSSSLTQVLPTVGPDQILTSLLQDKNAAESALVKLMLSMGDQNPEVLAQKAVVGKLDSQIDARVKGILLGMKLQLQGSQAQVAGIQKKLEATQQRDQESIEKYQPYFQAKRELEASQATLDEWKKQLVEGMAIYPPGSPFLK